MAQSSEMHRQRDKGERETVQDRTERAGHYPEQTAVIGRHRERDTRREVRQEER